jgi:hypothetical protein
MAEKRLYIYICICISKSTSSTSSLYTVYRKVFEVLKKIHVGETS